MNDSFPCRSGYVADTRYPSHFFRETMPGWMVAVLTALGRRTPDPSRPYSWMDLGCGSGLGVLIAAATNPLGRFVGVDFDLKAIEQARSLASLAGIGNASFHCLDFERVLQAPEDVVPACDFLVVHGVYSWVGPAARSAIRRIAAQRLKPGGVLCLSHLSHPGASSSAAVPKLLRLVAERSAGSSIERTRAGMAFLQRMAQSGAGYFHDCPGVLPVVPLDDDAELAYLAHDYLNEHRDALHIADVMADLAVIGCEYAGSAAPYENIDEASLPSGTLALLEELRSTGADASVLETFKDVARNQTQRCDYYLRRHSDGTLLPGDARRAALLAQRVGLLPAAPDESLVGGGTITFRSRIGPVRLLAEDVVPLLVVLRDGPRTHGELAQLPGYAGRPDFLNRLLQILAWAGWLHFLRPDHLPADGAAARKLNAVLARQPEPFNGPVMAAAAIGSAFPAPARGAMDARRCRWLAGSA